MSRERLINEKEVASPGFRLKLSVIAVAVLVVTVAACAGAGDSDEPREGSPGVEPAELADLTGKPLAKCRGLPIVQAACPPVVPAADRRYAGRNIPFARSRSTFELVSGAAYEGEPDRNRPPRFAHVVVEGGDLTGAFEFEWPPAPSEREPAELLVADRTEPALLAEPVWGGRAGMLVLMPSFEIGGIHGDHLLFQWREDGVDYLLSIHAWAPIEEARATLRAMVEALLPPSGVGS